jgi:hypothetical protein
MVGRLRTRVVLAVIALLGVVAPAAARAGDDQSKAALAVQAGWWSVEAQYKGRSGLFAAPLRPVHR